MVECSKRPSRNRDSCPVNARRPQRPPVRETKPFKPMAVPKAGFEQIREPRNKSLIGLIILLAIIAIAVTTVILLVKSNRRPATPKPTVTKTYIGLADPQVTKTPIRTLSPSLSAEPSETPSITPSRTASSTPTETATPTQTSTPSPTRNLTPSGFPFTIRNNSLFPHTMYFPDERCETSIYIVGQVLDFAEKDVVGYQVNLSGLYNGKEVNKTSKTGSMTHFGASGFGFILPNNPSEDDELSIQLFDDNGIQRSDKFQLEIFGECDKNLRLIRYKQTGDL